MEFQTPFNPRHMTWRHHSIPAHPHDPGRSQQNMKA